MNSDMLRVMNFPDESSSALVTVVTVLACMERHVELEISCCGELFTTHATAETVWSLCGKSACGLKIFTNVCSPYDRSKLSLLFY